MFTLEQKRIYQGLKEIGEEISNFYKDAVSILDENCKIASKANLVAHLAREIDGGIRNVFAPDLIKKGLEKQYTGIENKGHFVSIVAALGNVKNDKLVSEWFDIATRFAKIAHRHGSWKKTKEINEIEALWKRYEKVLLSLVGSFYSIFDRLARICELEEPTLEIIGTLGNILKNPKSSYHFFMRLAQPKWIIHLKHAGYFNSENAPKTPQNDPYPPEWLPVRYLLNIAKQHYPDNEKNVIPVYKKIREDYLTDKLELNPYTVTIFAEILIELQTYSFNENDRRFFEKFDLISVGNNNWNLHGTYLTDQLPQAYLTRQDKGGMKNLLEYCFGFSVYSRGEADFFGQGLQPLNEILYLVEGYRLTTFVDKLGNEIVFLLGEEAIEVAESVIKSLHNVDSFKFSSSAIPSIEPSNQSTYSEEWETAVIRFVTNGILLLKEEETRAFVERYLSTGIDIFQRIAFHVIRKKYEELGDLFFTFLNTNNLGKLFMHEPYFLLQEKSKLFSEEAFGKIVYSIENIKVEKFSRQETDEELLQYKYHQIRRWLSALEPNGENQMKLYRKTKEKYDSLDTSPLTHAAFDSYRSFTTGPDFPISANEFEAMSVNEQVIYLLHFNPGREEFNPREGLAKLLKSAFVKEPFKYMYDLTAFEELPFVYLHDLVDGFIEILNKKGIVDPDPIIDFLIQKATHASPAGEKGRIDYKRWFITSAAQFLEALSKRHDALNLSIEQLMKMSDFIILLLEQDEFKDDNEIIRNDYPTHILNSTQGRLHIALISLAIAWAEKNGTSQNVKWPTATKNYFTGRLDGIRRKDKNFSIALGYFFATLMYLDKDWCQENLRHIFPDDNVNLEFTLSSCLSSYSKLYLDLFEILKNASLIDKALDLYRYNCGPLGTIMKYALIEYSAKGVRLDEPDSTLASVLREKDPAQIEKLVEITWKSKIVSGDKLSLLWDAIFDALSPEPEQYPVALKSLIRFIDLIDDLTDNNRNRLLRSVTFFTINDREAYSFVRSVFKLEDTHLKNAGILILATFRQTQLPPFMTDSLEQFMEKLYQNGFKETADDICICVGDTGQLALKDVYDKYNS